MAESDIRDAELPLEGAGARLRNARNAAGLSRNDIAARTKVAVRHLAAIEEGRFSDLASRTYAVGFSRAYARTLGLDEAEIVRAVRRDLAAIDASHAPSKPAEFEPGDPARVPAAGLAWLAGLAALGVLAAVFFAWRSFFDPAVPLPDLVSEREAPAQAASAPPRPVRADPAGPVVFTALEPDIWVKFYDSSGQQLMQRRMAMGETYTVPAEAEGPRIWTGRPDALRITIAGKPVPPLAEGQTIVKDAPVSAAALLARGKDEAIATGAGGALAASAVRAAPAGSGAQASTVSE